MSPETFDTIGPRSPDYGYAEWLGDAANTEFSRHMLSTPNDDDNLERSHGSDARPSQRSPDVGGGVFGRGVSRCHASIGCQGSSTRHYVNGV